MTASADVHGDWGRYVRARLGLHNGPDKAKDTPHPATPIHQGEAICVACGLSLWARIHR